MKTNNEMAKEIRGWLISYAELAASVGTFDCQMIYGAKMQACVQIAEGCGLLDYDDAVKIWSNGPNMTRDEIAAMFKGVK